MVLLESFSSDLFTQAMAYKSSVQTGGVLDIWKAYLYTVNIVCQYTVRIPADTQLNLLGYLIINDDKS